MSSDDTESDSDASDAESAVAVGGKRARQLENNAKIWEYLGVNKGDNKKYPVCVHCAKSVNVHNKIDRVTAHLKSCTYFHKSLSDVPKDEWPDFISIKKVTLHEASSVKKFVLPKLSAADRHRFYIKLAKFFYVTGTPFDRVENKYLLEALQVLRPDVDVPSRKALSGPMLEEAYEEVQGAVMRRFEGKYVGLVTGSFE
jgi:hypothetical protein